MIKSIKIKGFQSHKDSYLEFSKDVNILCGSSDSGKTAVIRALLWVFQNRPGGNAFCSSWTDETLVQIEVDNHIITRFRSKTINNYTLDGLEFNAIGTDVPKEIQDILNIEEVNISCQLDSPFLLSKSSGEISAYFNKVARLDKIDLGLQNVQRWIRELEQDIKYKDGQLTGQETALQVYEYLDKMESEVEVLEGMESALQGKETRKKALSNLITDYQDNQKELKGYEEILLDEKLVNQILQFIEDRAEIDIKEVKLERLVDKIKEVRDEIREYEEVLGLEEQVSSLLSIIDKRKELEDSKYNIEKLVKRIGSLHRECGFQQIILEDSIKKFDKEMPNICPLCNQPIKK